MSVLKAHGISSGSYKRLFSGNSVNGPPRIRKLIDLISNRARRGISTCLQEWRAYAAIDTAYDVPFQQTTPTLIRSILGRKWERPEELRAAIAGWGLSEESLFIKESLPDGREGLIPNAPVFYGILIPLVKAYTTMRLAKIFNERNQSPLLQYKPLKMTSRNQVLCEIITDIAETISNWYGYGAVMRQAIQQMLKYGVALTFTKEEWHCEEQDVFNAATGQEETVVIKEGLRYDIPHPTRMFYDLTHPLTTINSDSGISWCGHWTLKTYGDILDNKMYWNRKSVFSGTNWFSYGYGSDYYFQEFFPCVMANDYVARFGQSLAPPSREDKAAWYHNSDRDQAVFLTEFFIKLVPADWGLGQYDGKGPAEAPWGKMIDTYHHPVWHRFTLAGDDTVIWAEPMAYCPSWFMGYHYDAQAGRQDSQALQVIPWQDLLGDLLNHMVDVAKQNLANCTFYDTNLVDKGDIDRLRHLGQRMYRGLNFVGFDSLLAQRAGSDAARAFVPVRMDKQSVVELLQVLPVVLSIMERVLQIAAQEVGAAASHQQSKQEVMQTGSASSNGVLFTSSFVDEGIDAWMRQLNDAALAYLDPEFTAQVSSNIKDLQTHLSELGFRVEATGPDVVLVRGHKDRLRLEGFAAQNTGPTENRERETAQIIFQTVQTIASQPMLATAVGAKNLLALIEEAAKLAGAPRDFTLTMLPEDAMPDQIPPAIMQAIQSAQQATMQAVGEKVAQPAAQEIAQDQQRLQSLENVVQQLQQIFEVAKAEQEKAQALNAKVAADAQRKDVQAQRAEQRKDAAAAAAIQRDAVKAQADMELQRQRAETELQLKSIEAAHSAAVAEKTAESQAKAASKKASD